MKYSQQQKQTGDFPKLKRNHKLKPRLNTTPQIESIIENFAVPVKDITNIARWMIDR